MKHEYKVGDKVRALVDGDDITEGNVYEVCYVANTWVKVTDDVGEDNLRYLNQIEPVTETPKYDLEAMGVGTNLVSKIMEVVRGKDFPDRHLDFARALAEILNQWADEQEEKPTKDTVSPELRAMLLAMWYPYVAADADETAWAFEKKPEPLVDEWGRGGNGRRISHLEGYTRGTCDWQDSLIDLREEGE